METESTTSSPKQSSELDDTIEIEFDGNTVLCRVCGDRASGFHYGVHACEGCKGFFRRSIQQKIQYRPCLKNQLCLITRVNRNRCQYCRLKKCIAVGMSRDAVRFGRVPKREKAKIMEQMQKVNIQCHGSVLEAILCNEAELRRQIIDAHLKTCKFTRANFEQFYKDAWSRPEIVHCPAHMACPLNPFPDAQNETDKWDQLSDCFMPAICNVVNFAKCIPGFSLLSQEDQVTLLKAGTFEVLLVHLVCLFDSKNNTMLFTNGKIFKRTSLLFSPGAGYLLDSMFDFAERFNELNLTDEEVALFSALVIISADRPGLRGADLVEKLQMSITRSLQLQMKANHHDDPSIFTKLHAKVSELRMLNTVHSEKLLGLSVPPSDPQLPVSSAPFPVSSGCRVSAEDHLSYKSGCHDLDRNGISVSGAAFEFNGSMKSEDCESKVEAMDLRGRSGSLVSESARWSSSHVYGGGDADHRSMSAYKRKGVCDDYGGQMPRNSIQNEVHSDGSGWASKSSSASHGVALPSTNSTLAAHPSGSSIIAHQVMMKTVQQELILTTPVGTFHRMPLNLWTTGAGAASTVGSSSSGMPRMEEKEGNAFRMEKSPDGKREDRRPWKRAAEVERNEELVEKSVIVAKKKVMRTWSEDTSSSKLSCSSCCSDSNADVDVLRLKSLHQAKEPLEETKFRSSPQFLHMTEKIREGSSSSSSLIDLPFQDTSLAASPTSGHLQQKSRYSGIKGTSTVSLVDRVDGDSHGRHFREGDQLAGTVPGLLYMSPGSRINASNDRNRNILVSPATSPTDVRVGADVDRAQPLPSFAAENLLKPNHVDKSESNDREMRLATKATLKERLLKRIDSKDNINSVESVIACGGGGGGVGQSTYGSDHAVPSLDGTDPAFPLRFISEYPRFYPLGFPPGFHPGVLYNHFALQHLHAVQQQQQQQHKHLQVQLSHAMLGRLPAAGGSSSLPNAPVLHSATGSPLMLSNSSEHLSLDGSSENEEIKHLTDVTEHLAHQSSSLLLKSETS